MPHHTGLGDGLDGYTNPRSWSLAPYGRTTPLSIGDLGKASPIRQLSDGAIDLGSGVVLPPLETDPQKYLTTADLSLPEDRTQPMN